MSIASRHTIQLLMAGLLALPATVGAQEDLEPSVVFFELYVRNTDGEKTPEYVRSIESDIRQYKQYSTLLRSDALKRIRTQMITPAKRVNDAKLQGIEKMVAEGDKLLYDNPKKAIEVLRKAKLELKEIVENISLDSKIRKDYFTTQMLLVRSHLDNQNATKARQIMSEVVRVFEDEYPVTEDNYHPNVVELYKDVFRSLKDQRTASLKVTTNPAGCNVFINGRARKQNTPFTYTGLYPGAIRVQVTKDQAQSMVRRVEVPDNGTATLHIDLEYETALTFNGNQFGLTFSNHASVDKNLVPFAVKLGKFLQVDYVAVSGVLTHKNSPMLAGYLVDVKNKQLVRKNHLPVKSNVVSNRRISDMSAMLAGIERTKKETAQRPWYNNGLGWGLAGGAVISLGVGTGFFVKRQGHVDEVNKAYPTPATPANIKKAVADKESEADSANTAELIGWTFTGLGVALAASSVVVFMLKDDNKKDEKKTALSGFYAAPIPLQTGGGFVTGFNF